jgi:hypothetical protein
MVQKTITVDTGSSKAAFDKKSLFAATFLDDKKAGAQVHKSIFANNKRKYTRNKTVYECRDCAGGWVQRSKLGEALHKFDVFLWKLFVRAFWIMVIFLCISFVMSQQNV